jgi:hypothetical protein
MDQPLPVEIFVFGSNLQGIHGAGAALFARHHYGAIHGQGSGLQATSYAIPTKRTPWQRLSLEEIKPYVDEFIQFATAHPEFNFKITRIGCGMAGYTDADIAPMFKDAPPNCNLPEGWQPGK